MQSVIGKLDGSVMSMLVNDLDEASREHMLESEVKSADKLGKTCPDGIADSAAGKEGKAHGDR